VWFRATGDRMEDHDWQGKVARSLQVFLSGQGLAMPGPRGERILDDRLGEATGWHQDAPVSNGAIPG
jgi:isoamylase